MSSAPDRLARLLTLVPYLLARPGVRVDEAAREFGVSAHQLVDDLQLLFVCGLPGHLPDDLIDVSFEGGAIHLANADTIARPLRLDADETVALLAGLRMLADVRGDSADDTLDRVTAKLERAAGDALAAAAATLSVDAQPSSRQEAEAVGELRRALATSRAVALTYYVPGRDELTERIVDPMRLLVVDGRAYLEGWCRRADGVRLFRADRIHSLRVLDDPARVPEAARPRELAEGVFHPSDADTVVVLDAAPSARWVADYYPVDEVEDTATGTTRITLRAGDPAWVVRLALQLGGALRVVAPAELAERVRVRASAGLSRYDEVGP